jgi:hypothetical protein
MGNHRPYRDKNTKEMPEFLLFLRVLLRALRAFAVALGLAG